MKPLILIALPAFLAVAMPAFADTNATQGNETAGQYVDDSMITTRIKAAFLSDPNLKLGEIKVETYKGVVQLSGFVSNDNDISHAADVASGINGVKSVKNDLHLKQ